AWPLRHSAGSSMEKSARCSSRTWPSSTRRPTPYTAPSPSSRAAAPVGWKDSAATARSRARAGAAPTWRRSNSGPEVVRRAVHQWTGVISGGAKGLSVASAQRRAAWLRLSLTDARSQPAPARPPVPLPSRRGLVTYVPDHARPAPPLNRRSDRQSIIHDLVRTLHRAFSRAVHTPAYRRHLRWLAPGSPFPPGPFGPMPDA